MQYKFDRERAIERQLDFKARVFAKMKTKGRFDVSTKTNAGNFTLDRKWQMRANAIYNSLQL